GGPDDGQGAQRGLALDDGGRPEGRRDGRGRRQARRRLPGDRRAAEGLRRGPGHGHPARRVRDHRDRDRPGDARLPAGLRDPVRRLRLPGLRPDRQPARQDARAQPRHGADADHRPHPLRRGHRRRRAPQREPGGLLRAHRRPEGGGLLQPRRRLVDAAPGGPQRRPGHLLRAQAALLGEGRGRHPRTGRPPVAGAGGPSRHRRDAHRVRADGEDVPGGGHRGRGGRAQPGGARPALAVAAGPAVGRRVGTTHPPCGRRARGAVLHRHRCRDRRPAVRGALLRDGGAGAACHRLRHALPAVPARGGVPPRPRPRPAHRRPIAGVL
ncbi:MAG: Branched-chain alpha-keto acid dehydrogenase, E1 component, beta subunit, partial [uncultured Frankineae bacterium]